MQLFASKSYFYELLFRVEKLHFISCHINFSFIFHRLKYPFNTFLCSIQHYSSINDHECDNLTYSWYFLFTFLTYNHFSLNNQAEIFTKTVLQVDETDTKIYKIDRYYFTVISVILYHYYKITQEPASTEKGGLSLLRSLEVIFGLKFRHCVKSKSLILSKHNAISW